MYPLFESIRCENGRIRHLPYHEARMLRSRKQIFDLATPLNIRKHIKVPIEAQKGVYKVRVSYGKEIGPISVLPYQQRNIESIRVIPIAFEYAHKWENRAKIHQACQKLNAVEEALFVKNDLI